MQIRLATPDDAAQIAAIYAPIVTDTHISFEERAPSVDEMRRRITAYGTTHPWLVAIEDGAILGYAYATAHRDRAGYRWSADSSIYLADGARRRGLGTRLYVELFRILKVQRFHNVFAGVTLPNDASVALHRKLGFTRVGIYRSVGFKCGSLYDTSWWQLRLIESPALPPDEPLPMRAVGAIGLGGEAS